MDKRHIIIIIALALPVIGFALLSSSNAPPAKIEAKAKNATAKHRYPTLEEARAQVTKRLAELNALTPEQWPDERKRHAGAPPTLQEAVDKNKAKLAELNATTPEQWNAQHGPKPKAQTPAQAPAQPLAATPAR